MLNSRPRKSADEVAGGLAASGFEDGAAVAHGGGAGDEVGGAGGFELLEELERHHLVVEVGVVVRRVADEVGEGRVHAVAVDKLVAGEAVVALAEQRVEIEIRGAAGRGFPWSTSRT